MPGMKNKKPTSGLEFIGLWVDLGLLWLKVLGQSVVSKHIT